MQRLGGTNILEGGCYQIKDWTVAGNAEENYRYRIFANRILSPRPEPLQVSISRARASWLLGFAQNADFFKDIYIFLSKIDGLLLPFFIPGKGISDRINSLLEFVLSVHKATSIIGTTFLDKLAGFWKSVFFWSTTMNYIHLVELIIFTFQLNINLNAFLFMYILTHS